MKLSPSTHLVHGCRHSMSFAIVAALVALASPSPLSAGVALKLQYDSITGTAVSDLTNNPSFPNSPTAYEPLVAGLQEAVNTADNFGTWTRGFIEAPQTGLYTFWIASDDDSALWLSPTLDPAAKTKIGPGGLRISWPDSTAGLVLKQSLDLASPSWLPVTESQSISGGQKQVLITPSARSWFFKLATP